MFIAKSALIALLTAHLLCGGQSTFDFHSNFWVNLHHFLYEQAASKSPEQVDSADWRRALEVYRAEIALHDLLGREIAGINGALSQVENAPSLKGAAITADLVETLERAAAVYRARWWPQHNRQNLAWIAAVTPLVAKYEDGMKKDLAAAYQTAWPGALIRTDVVEYAGWAGAYTLIEPTHITILGSAGGDIDVDTVETLFHEASHGMIQKISDALTTEAETRGRVFQRRAVWHAVLFYTAGEIARRHLGDYTPFAFSHGVYDRGWPGIVPILDRDWRPYLDGKIDLATAVKRLVADYGVARPAK